MFFIYQIPIPLTILQTNNVTQLIPITLRHSDSITNILRKNDCQRFTPLVCPSLRQQES